MSDYAHRETDRQLAALEKQIADVYKQAYDDVSKTVKDYFTQFAERDKKEQARLENGEITQNEYNQWRLAQIGRGERYQTMRDKLADRYTNANEVAVSYVNDKTPGIYSLNRNYSAYTIEQTGADVDFTLYDESTVKRLITEQPDLMPNYPEAKAIRRGIDLAYGKQQITASVTSSILQGESVYKIADDLMDRITTMSRESAIRTARTAFTEAENAGRQDSYEAAEDMGIKMSKRWVATLDDRTRESHIEADGQTVGVDESFKVGDSLLEYPGDSNGEPSEVYNCRCTVIAVVDGNEYKDAERRGEGERYEKWLEEKEAEQDNGFDEENLIEFIEAETKEEAENFAKNELGFEDCDYSRINLDVANTINEETAKLFNIFDGVSDYLNGIRYIPKKEDWYAAYSPGFKELLLRNVTSKSSLSKMGKDAQAEYNAGTWSTGAAQHSIRHELGHAVEASIRGDSAKMSEIGILRENICEECNITSFWNDLTADSAKKAGGYLSYYGLKDDGEFIAESVAEYMNGNARETANQVVEIIRR